jgi:hypothetical protein
MPVLLNSNFQLWHFIHGKKLDFLLTLFTKLSPKRIKDISMKSKTLTFVEEYLKLHQLEKLLLSKYTTKIE